jgi:KipI family sensor histidine kinase inhibitor
VIRVGESAFLLELGRSPAVLAAQRAIETLADPAIVDLVPGARTLLVVADPIALALPDESQLARIERTARELVDDRTTHVAATTHEIAVRYDGDDLAELAAHAGLHIDDVIARHARATYRVAFVGFQPGFAYLDGLPLELHAPRRSTPRPRVPVGSVAIGGAWTGIYPLATPGGWNLVGTTDAVLFDGRRPVPALLQPGDAVRFVPR